MTSEGVLLFLLGLAVQVFVMFPVGIASWLGKRALGRLEKSQAEILGEVQDTNGRVIRLEQEIKDHLVSDANNFERIDKRIDRMKGGNNT